MKRFLVVLLSIGFVMALSMSAFAVTPNFTGTYFVRGQYYNNPSLLDQDKGAGRDSWSSITQEFRLFTRMMVVDGLSLTMRADILENLWGLDQDTTNPLNATTVDGTGITPGAKATDMKRFNTQNISIEQIYMTFWTGIGTFKVGQKSSKPFGFGTFFLNSAGTGGGIDWEQKFGKWTVTAEAIKKQKGDMSPDGVPREPLLGQQDVDKDFYDVTATYKGKGWESGMLVAYFRNADKRTTAASSFLVTNYMFDPYFKAQMGPLDLEGEAYYMMGKKEFDTSTATRKDRNIKASGGYLQAKYNMGPAWVGASFIYTSGNDPNSTDANGQDITGNVLSVFGYARDNSQCWAAIHAPTILVGTISDPIHLYTPPRGKVPDKASPLGGAALAGGGAGGGIYDNMILYSLKAGYTASKRLSFDGNLWFAAVARLDDKLSSSDKLGTEIDLHAQYKIYDNLSYNVGVSYLFTGDYFKATPALNPAGEDVKNVYQLTHWLTLTL